MCNTGDTSYDEELKKIEFLSKHPSYLPYIGTEYRNSKLKILHVGNCHYIEPSQDPKREYGYTFFRDNWFDETKCSDDFNLPPIIDMDRQMSECPKDLEWEKNNLSCENAWNEYCFNTRSVIGEVLSGVRHKKNLHGGFILYPIFREAIIALGSSRKVIPGFSDYDITEITILDRNEEEAIIKKNNLNIEKHNQKIEECKQKIEKRNINIEKCKHKNITSQTKKEECDKKIEYHNQKIERQKFNIEYHKKIIEKCKLIIEKCKLNIEDYERKIEPYLSIAYTDFHFIPSLINGEAQVDDSLVKSAVEKIMLDLICGWENNNLEKKVKLILKNKNSQKEVNWLEKSNIAEIKNGLLKREGKQIIKESMIETLLKKVDGENEFIVKNIELTDKNNNKTVFKHLSNVDNIVSGLVSGIDEKQQYEVVKKYACDLVSSWEKDLELQNYSNTELKLNLINKAGDSVNCLEKSTLEDIVNGLNNDEGKKTTVSIIESLITKENNDSSNIVDEIGLYIFDSDEKEPLVYTCKDILDKVKRAKCEANEFYNKSVVPESIKVLDEIVKIIKPDLIWITSKPVSDLYNEHMMKCDDEILTNIAILYANHPNSLHKKEEKVEFRKELTQKVKEVYEKKKSSSPNS